MLATSDQRDPIEDGDLPLTQCCLWSGPRIGAMCEGEPQDSPCNDAEQREEVGDPFRRLEPRLLCPAARLQNLVEGLDLPPHRIPADLLQCVPAGPDRQVREELPLD